jgi:hypothetical protein
MKTKTYILIVMIIFVFSCKKDAQVGSTNNAGNLIANSSFETDAHQPDYNGWAGTAYLVDSLGNHNIPLIQDTPNGGGLWCVQLEPLWMPTEGYTESSVTGQTGTHIYKVTAWIKTINWIGSVSLEQLRNGQLIVNKQLTDSSSVWKQISLLDTLTVLSTDILKVHLSAGTTEVLSGKVRFDNVKLENTNP